MPTACSRSPPRPDDRRPHYPVDHFFRRWRPCRARTRSAWSCRAPARTARWASARSRRPAGSPSRRTSSRRSIRACRRAPRQRRRRPGAAARGDRARIWRRCRSIRTWPARRRARVDGRRPRRAVSARDRAPCAPPRAWTSASIATPRSSGARRGGWCCAASRRRATTREFVERDRAEAEALYRDVLINVTSFFRDPEMFEDLKREVFPEIVAGKREGRADPGLGARAARRARRRTRSPSRCSSTSTTASSQPAASRSSRTDLGDPAVARSRRAPASTRRASRPRSARSGCGASSPRKTGDYRVQKQRPRHVRVRPAERHGRSAVLARRPDHLPQRADLHVAAAAAAPAAGLPLRAQPGWLPGARHGRDGRAVRRPVRAGQPRAQDLSQEGDGEPAAADVHGRRLARRRAGRGRRRRQPAAGGFSARSRSADRSAAMRRRACW